MKSDRKNRDWINEYLSLKQINPANPFTVPAGYFNDLEDRVVSYKNILELKGKILDGFTIPEGYFEELPVNIQSRIAVEELVPAGNMGLTVPDGYFDELSDKIKSRVMVEEAVVNANDHFSVPAGYFDQLNKNILDKTVHLDGANRKGVIRKLFASTAVKYAAAACFALVLGGGVLLIELNNPEYIHQHSFLHQQLSNIPVNEIESYLQLNVDPGDTQQSVATDAAPAKQDNLRKALQDYADSVQ
jgi:hypothetical protein